MPQRNFNEERPDQDIHYRLVTYSDEQLLEEFFCSVSDESLYNRFFTSKKKRIQEQIKQLMANYIFNEVTVLATIESDGPEKIIGMGQYFIDEPNNNAEVALMVQDDYQKLGIGTELVKYLTNLARKQGLSELTAEVLAESTVRLGLFEKLGFKITKRVCAGIYKIRINLM